MRDAVLREGSLIRIRSLDHRSDFSVTRACFGLGCLAAVLDCSAQPSRNSQTVTIDGSSGVEIAEPASTGASSARPHGGTIAWLTAEEEARAKAARNDVPLLVYLSASWATKSLKMDCETWSDPKVVDQVPRSDWLRVDLSDSNGDAEAYAVRFEVNVVPTTILFDFPRHTRRHAPRLRRHRRGPRRDRPSPLTAR